ncbi:MAG: LTA synthase family protein [Endomicrobia bacterium]|nr:LTA synthase family protein [Endomicrobiia bacterium]
MFIDIFYYEHSARRLSAIDLLSLPTHFGSMVVVVLTRYWYGILTFLCIFTAVNYFLIKIIKTLQLKFNDEKNETIVNQIFYFFVFIIICTVFIRGGFQNRPLRPAFAFGKGSIQLGHLTLNGLYTVLHSFRETKKYTENVELVDYNFAVETLRRIIKTKNEKFLDDTYPLLRQTFYNEPRKKLNVIIFIMEGWSPWVSKVYDNKYSDIIPFFDEIAKEGLLFTNFYSYGTRTWPVLTSVLFSIPSVYLATIVEEPFNQNTYRSIAHILKEYGYSTIFLHGGKKNFFSFDLATEYLGGFEKCIFMDDFDLSKVKIDKAWGVHDEYVFLRANEEFKKLKQPFLGVILGLTAHEPYDIPEEFKVIPSTVPYSDYLNALKYSDYGLRRFFEQAKKEKYFEDTLFIILSDHPNLVDPKKQIETFKIVCLFYSPKYIKPKKCNMLAGQLDVLPSIIDFLKISTIHSSFGKSVFSNDNERYVLCSQGEIVYWIRNEKVLLHNFEKPIGIYDYISDIYFQKNMVGSSYTEKLENELFSFLTVARKVLIHNLVYHPKIVQKKVSTKEL